jgi:hypothetical protein
MCLVSPTNHDAIRRDQTKLDEAFGLESIGQILIFYSEFAQLGKQKMPRDGAIIFSDLTGKLDVLRVSCEKCGRDGGYRLNGLIEKRGRDAKLIDWLDELTAECRKKIAHNMNDPRGAKCPQLPRVL